MENHEQIVNRKTPYAESVNKTQISFGDEKTSNPEIQTGKTTWDGETNLIKGESSDESSVGSSPYPIQIRSTTVKSRRSAGNRRMTSTQGARSVNSRLKDVTYLREKRFFYAERMMPAVDHIYACVSVIGDDLSTFTMFFCKIWTHEQLINHIVPRLRRHNVKRLYYENYSLDEYVPINNDEDLEECFRVSEGIVNLLVDGVRLPGNKIRIFRED